MISIFLIGALGAYVLHLKNREKRLASSLTEQKKETTALLDLLSEGVVILDGGGGILRVNLAAAALLGQELDKKSPLTNKALSLIIECQKLNKPLTDSIYIEKEKKKYFELLTVPLKQHIFLIVRDKSSEQKILEVGKNFIANASHELKTPITIIKGFAEMLRDMEEVPKEMLDEILEKIVRNSKRMDNLVRSLLTLSDIESIPLCNHKECDLANLVEESKRSILTVYPNADLRIIQKSEVSAEVDPGILELAIVNLLDNAIKYSKGAAKVTVSLQQNSDTATVSIQDEGVGISEGDLEHIFDRFYTVNKARSRKLGGAGLGLSLVKTIIEKHEGTLNVTSVPGKGSTFTLSLPRFH